MKINLSSHILICIGFATSFLFSNAVGNERSCEHDQDCTPVRATDLPKENRQICVNSSCTCPPDHTSSNTYYDYGFDYCFLNLINTGKSCEDNSNCDPLLQRCLQNGTCWKCTFGKFKSSTDNCEGPFYGDVCLMSLTGAGSNMYNGFPYGRSCQGDGFTCDNSVCICKGETFYNADLKTCTPLPKLGEDCTLSQRCKDDENTYGFTKCSVNNTCACIGLYNNQTNFCLQKPTGRCRNHDHCPENSRCIGSECDCGRGYVDSRNGECLRFMSGSRCESNPDAQTQKALDHQGLKCINGAYRCKIPTGQYYDVGPEGQWHWSRYRHICVIEVGGPCMGLDDTRCTDGAFCVDVNGKMECQCGKGHSSTPENKCLNHVEFGANCVNDKCNHNAGLVCMDDTCQCPDQNIQFDPVLKRCLSPEGHFCGTLFLGESVKIECKKGLNCGTSKGPILSGLKCLKDQKDE